MSEETKTPTQEAPTHSQNGLATAEQLCGGGLKRRFKYETLPIKQLKIRIQSLSASEKGKWEAKCHQIAKNGGVKFVEQALATAERRLIVLCLVDEEGNCLLRKNHIGPLGDWDAADTSYVYEACASWCGINTDDIEELVKNSAATPTA